MFAVTGSTPGSQRVCREKGREFGDGRGINPPGTRWGNKYHGNPPHTAGVCCRGKLLQIRNGKWRLHYSLLSHIRYCILHINYILHIPTWDCFPSNDHSVLFRVILFQRGVTYPRPKCCQPHWPMLPCLNSHKFQRHSALTNSSLRNHFSLNEANITEDISNNTLISCSLKLIPLQYLRY